MEEKYGLSTKKFMVEEIAEKLKENPNFVITEYKGLASSEIESLRKELHKTSSAYLVVKNSLVKKAFDQLKIKDLDEFIEGQTGLSLANDIIGTSKTLVDFSKDHAALKIKCAFIDGKIETTDRVKHLAMLPPREVLLAMVFNGMKAPITGFVGVLGGLLRKFVYAINEIKNKKEGGDKK